MKKLDGSAPERDGLSPNTNSPLEQSIAERFGCLPNFFRLAGADPQITANLWGFAQFAYLDNPLPSLFKERLFVYLSRFCEVRYCVARHMGFLVGLGQPAGDAACAPQTVGAVLPLLRLPLVHGEDLEPLLEACRELEAPIRSFPPPDSAGERTLFACAAHVFLQTADAARARAALGSIFDPVQIEHLNLFLSFIRMAHYWTKLHPEIAFEDDVTELLKTHEALAAALFNDPAARADGLSGRITAELALLRDLRRNRDSSLRELVSAIPGAVYACDTNGGLFYYNQGAVDLWGRAPRADEHPWSFRQALYRTDGTAISSEEEPIRKVLTSGTPLVNHEMVLERPDSSRVDILVNVAPLRDNADRLAGAVSVVQDISEIKRAQQERERLLHDLERSNAELSRFSYAVSHDLQSPVRSLRALAQLLIRRSDGLDAVHLAGMIEKSAAGMECMIDSLLHYAQVGQGELKRQTTPVDAVVERVRASLRDLVSKTSACISCAPLPVVDADPVLLEQLFQNLIVNAIKYRRPEHSPVIEIEGAQSEEGWWFTVTDYGQGIPSEYRAMIFEPLKRLHGTDTPGSGLGLALCRTIVARHGGRIWVESAGAGMGATFHFTVANPAR